MLPVRWLDASGLLPAMRESLINPVVVLDIGCGIRQQELVRPLVHICCEPFTQYVERLRDKLKDEYDRNYIFIKATWAEAVRMFPPKSVDTVFLVDVVEHVEKEEGRALLKATELIARRQVVIFTPLGFMPQHHEDGKDAWGMDGGDWQEHKSGWSPEDFDETYDIYAAKDYHAKDNMGNELEVPFGAFWAVKTMDGPGREDDDVSFRKEKQRAILEVAIDAKDAVLLERVHTIAVLTSEIEHTGTLDRLVSLLKALLKLKHSKLNKHRQDLLRRLGLIE